MSNVEQWPLNRLLEMPYSQYAQAPGINKSGLDHILRSPAHYQAYLEGKMERSSDDMDQGRITHVAVLEPDVYQRTVVIKPKLSKKAEEAFIAEALLTQPSALFVTQKQHDLAMSQRDGVWANADARALLARGEREASVFWDDPVFKVRCKARVDFVSRANPKGICVDLKTTRDATRNAFARSMVSYSYDMQASHYMEGGAVSGQYSGQEFFFIAVEKKAPFATVVYSLSDWCKTRGFKWREEAMSIYAQAYRSQVWPSLPTADEIGLPKWAKVPGEEEEYAQ